MLIAFTAFSQNELYSSLTIPEDLKKNANAVLRLDATRIEVPSVKKQTHSYRRIITVLNKKGNNHLRAGVGYDSKISVKKLSVLIYDKFGNEIKKYKKSDFKDVAAVSSISLYEDSRVKYLEYTPINYPYTVELFYETETSNTGYLPFWRPLEGYFISTENSSFEVVYDESVGINVKEKNFSNYNITNETSSGHVNYIAKNIDALKREEYSPMFKEFGPQLLVSPTNFHYEGYLGSINNWTDLGKWIHDKLLVGRSNISPETKKEVLNLVGDIKDPIEKAKIIYDYVQQNTRYISVQVGIGGIQPISAEEVDNVKYGDCKGLTNYTKALLDLVGVESFYTEVYASPEMQYSVDPEFATLFGQGNHVILNIPLEGNDSKWLECTSQTMPFGFLGDFTDNRDVFVITPNGGKIIKTPKYSTELNTQIIKGKCAIDDKGNIDVDAQIVSKGIQYDNKFGLANIDQSDIEEYYKEARWDYINNLEFNKTEILNNKDDINFTEDIKFHASSYVSSPGERMLIKLNVLNRLNTVPDRYRNRKLPLKINRGFKDIDEVEMSLPLEYEIESIPQSKVIETKFGTYIMEVIVKNEQTLLYRREFVVNDGEFPKEDYKDFRDFYKEVSRSDNAKIALIKK